MSTQYVKRIFCGNVYNFPVKPNPFNTCLNVKNRNCIYFRVEENTRENTVEKMLEFIYNLGRQKGLICLQWLPWEQLYGIMSLNRFKALAVPQLIQLCLLKHLITDETSVLVPIFIVVSSFLKRPDKLLLFQWSQCFAWSLYMRWKSVMKHWRVIFFFQQKLPQTFLFSCN